MRRSVVAPSPTASSRYRRHSCCRPPRRCPPPRDSDDAEPQQSHSNNPPLPLHPPPPRRVRTRDGTQGHHHRQAVAALPPRRDTRSRSDPRAEHRATKKKHEPMAPAPTVADRAGPGHATGACSGSHQCSNRRQGRTCERPPRCPTWWGGWGEVSGEVGGSRAAPEVSEAATVRQGGSGVGAGRSKGREAPKKCDRPRQAVERAQVGARRGAGQRSATPRTGTVTQGPATQRTLPPRSSLRLTPASAPPGALEK